MVIVLFNDALTASCDDHGHFVAAAIPTYAVNFASKQTFAATDAWLFATATLGDANVN